MINVATIMCLSISIILLAILYRHLAKRIRDLEIKALYMGKSITFDLSERYVTTQKLKRKINE